MLTHPADLLCRHANHQGIGRYVTIDHRARTDKGKFTNGVATDDGAVGAQGRTTLDQRVAVFVLAGDGTTRVVYVGEHHARAAENVVFQRDVVVHRDVVLHLHVVADHNLVADKHVLTKGTIPADHRLTADMNPMPDASVFADLGAFVDDRRRVNRIVTHG